MELKEQISNRQEYNRKIVNYLASVVEQCPEWRFGQILYNTMTIVRKNDTLDIKDPFYEESYETYKRIKHE